jgi:hypothetical protein
MPQDAEPAESKNGGAAPDGAARDGDGAGGIGSFVYKLALAGVGALMLAQEEIEAAWKRTRRDSPTDGTSPSAAAVDGAAPAAEPAQEVQASTTGSPDGSRVWLQIDQAIGRVLRSLNIPTRDEVNQIGTKIDALVERLEARDRS